MFQSGAYFIIGQAPENILRYNWGYIEVNALMTKSKIEVYYKFDSTDANLWRTINLFDVNTTS